MAAATTRRKYGLDWPADIPDHQIELILWKHWREEPYCRANLKSPVHEHLLDACRMLFTEEQLVIHPWFETQARSWTEDTFAIWWGAAGTGKSHSLGLFTLLDFLTDPHCTYACLASTTKQMLEVRSYASVVQYLSYLRANKKLYVPYKFVRQPMVVMHEDSGDDVANLKHKIMGVAVQQGSTDEARQNLQGVHTTYVRLILDELAGMRPAAMEARTNLAQTKDFKLIGACNPESIHDEAGKFSMPLDGWTSIGLDSTEWSTRWGKVYRFDALKSPGIANPEKYPFLPTQATIDNLVQVNGGNLDAPAIWTFLRAFPPPQSSERTVLTDAMIRAYDMLAPVAFKDQVIKVAALDPAFTADGDACVLTTARVGFSVAGLMTICFDKMFTLKLEASNPKPILEQIVDQTLQILRDEDVSIDHFGVDDSGTQSVADAIAMRAGNSLFRCNFSTRPPDVPVSSSNPALASTKYRNTVSFLYFSARELAERGQIRGLFGVAAEQFCQRRVSSKQQPHALESKIDLKKRTGGKSPDAADSCAILVGLCRTVLGIVPGASTWNPAGTSIEPYGVRPWTADRHNNLESDYTSDFGDGGGHPSFVSIP